LGELIVLVGMMGMIIMIDVYVYIFLSQTSYQQKEKKGENWKIIIYECIIYK
jgi:hypothetical protein